MVLPEYKKYIEKDLSLAPLMHHNQKETNQIYNDHFKAPDTWSIIYSLAWKVFLQQFSCYKRSKSGALFVSFYSAFFASL